MSIKIFRCGVCHKHFPAEYRCRKWTVGARNVKHIDEFI